jgi:hypothetical protein
MPKYLLQFSGLSHFGGVLCRAHFCAFSCLVYVIQTDLPNPFPFVIIPQLLFSIVAQQPVYPTLFHSISIFPAPEKQSKHGKMNSLEQHQLAEMQQKQLNQPQLTKLMESLNMGSNSTFPVSVTNTPTFGFGTKQQREQRAVQRAAAAAVASTSAAPTAAKATQPPTSPDSKSDDDPIPCMYPTLATHKQLA